MERDHVNFIVGGCFFCLFMEDIEKYPESYFNAVIKKEWNPELEVPIKIDRDGMMFRYIAEFHHHGELPITKKRVDVDVVQQIQVEADFYNLPLLVKACEKYVVSRISDRFEKEHFVTCEYCSGDKDNLINVVGALWAPVCSKGEMSFNNDRSIMKSSTLLSLNVEELCAAAGPTLMFDAPVCGVFEISADQLNPEMWKHFVNAYPLSSFSPRMKLELQLRPCKLLICQQGSCVAEHRSVECGENHIGKLVQVLNSEFTGGELVVRQNDKEVSISKAGEWIAMYGDALRRVNPVTSGTRVALIFDLYNVGPIDEEMYFSNGDYRVELGCEREVSELTRASVYAALDKELNRYDDVIVCLQQVYLLNQADPDCLKGGDSVLYRLLAQKESEYSLSIVPLRLRYFTDQNDSYNCDLEGEEVDLENAMASDCNRFKKKKNILLAVPVTTSSDDQHCLGYFEQPGPDRLEIATWLATGLRICKHTEVSSETRRNQEADETARVGLKRDVPTENVDAPSKKFALG